MRYKKIMTNVFLVFGYGIPKNILKDENYNFYLKMVFNKIYDFSLKNKSTRSLIIFCGGKTDMFKPYKRNEADEMIKFFTDMIKQKPFLKKITKNWILFPEKDSLSTLENLIYSKNIILKRKLALVNLFIFCEQTREKRIKILAKKVFNKRNNLEVVPIDFDTSANRYLSFDYLAKKEKAELEHSLWSLQNPENLKKHHEIFEEKIAFLRQAGPKVHVEAVKKWWDQKLKLLKTK